MEVKNKNTSENICSFIYANLQIVTSNTGGESLLSCGIPVLVTSSRAAEPVISSSKVASDRFKVSFPGSHPQSHLQDTRPKV